MKLAAAQINSKVGKIQQNLDIHYQVIETAIKENVSLITFPEMWITGYCRKEGKGLAFSENDSRLNKFKELSKKGNIIIVVGAPIEIKGTLYIGSFIIYPNKPIDIYIKQYLHNGEALFYNAFMSYNPVIILEKERICFAICADISNANHPYQAKKNNCTIYLPSIFYSQNGIEEGHKHLKEYAKKYAFNILMSNYSGELWGMKSGRQSAFWDSKGQLISELRLNDSGILIAEKKATEWYVSKLILTL